jgi:DNA-binding NarL/FixJ family response regulator
MIKELSDICRMTILYADDDMDFTQMIHTSFAKNYANQIFITANNGKDALEQSELYKPDLFILDLNMPIVDGLSLMKQIKMIDCDKEVAAISVCNDEDKIQECLKSGFRFFIKKPINFDTFFYQVDCMMENVFWKRLFYAKNLSYLYAEIYKNLHSLPSRRH